MIFIILLSSITIFSFAENRTVCDEALGGCMEVNLRSNLPLDTQEEIKNGLGELESLNNQTMACENERPNKEPLWCKDFYRYTCEAPSNAAHATTYTNAKGFEFFFSRVREVAEPGQINSPLRLPMSGQEVVALTEFLSKHPEARDQVIFETEREIQSQLGITPEILNRSFGEARQELILAINKSSLSRIQKQEMKEKLDKIKLLDSRSAIQESIKYARANFSSEYENEAAIAEDVRSAFDATCSLGGFGTQAFTVEGTFIHFCTGMYLQLANNQGLSAEGIVTTLKLILGHELGHSLEDESLMSAFKSCLEAPTGMTSFDGLSSADKERLWDNQHREITSDYWAARAMAAHFKSRSITGEDAAKILRDSTKLFCTQGVSERPSADHPSAVFRLTAFSRDPEIRQILNCHPNTESSPACTPAGRIPSSR